MSSSWPNSGLRTTSEYQCSGMPFVTSSNDDECTASAVLQIKFPFVTRWVEINTWKSSAATSHLRVGFTENGVNHKGAVTGSVKTGVMTKQGENSWEKIGGWQALATSHASNTHANYYLVPASAAATTMGTHAVRLEFACTDLFLLADAGTTGFSIIAGLTNIPRDQMALTGSNGFQGVG